MSRIGVSVVRSTTLDGAGAGVVHFPGPAQWETLQVDAIALESTGGIIPIARLSVGGDVIATTRDGNAGQFSTTGPSDAIAPGGSWQVFWTGGSPGAVVTATLRGTRVTR